MVVSGAGGDVRGLRSHCRSRCTQTLPPQRACAVPRAAKQRRVAGPCSSSTLLRAPDHAAAVPGPRRVCSRKHLVQLPLVRNRGCTSALPAHCLCCCRGVRAALGAAAPRNLLGEVGCARRVKEPQGSAVHLSGPRPRPTHRARVLYTAFVVVNHCGEWIAPDKQRCADNKAGNHLINCVGGFFDGDSGTAWRYSFLVLPSSRRSRPAWCWPPFSLPKSAGAQQHQLSAPYLHLSARALDGIRAPNIPGDPEPRDALLNPRLPARHAPRELVLQHVPLALVPLHRPGDARLRPRSRRQGCDLVPEVCLQVLLPVLSRQAPRQCCQQRSLASVMQGDDGAHDAMMRAVEKKERSQSSCSSQNTPKHNSNYSTNLKQSGFKLALLAKQSSTLHLA